mgnify:CR=1 FL=1
MNRDYCYSDDDLLNILVEFYEKTGKLPAKRDIPQFTPIYRRFGSWGNALFEAGLIPYPMDRNELVDYRRELRRREYLEILKGIYKEHRENPDWKGVAGQKGRLSQKEYMEYYKKTNKNIPHVSNLYKAFKTYVIDDIWEIVEKELLKEGYFG